MATVSTSDVPVARPSPDPRLLRLAAARRARRHRAYVIARRTLLQTPPH